VLVDVVRVNEPVLEFAGRRPDGLIELNPLRPVD
jgi:hypothetical protein